jgi:arylsulfatase A-like enzyme
MDRRRFLGTLGASAAAAALTGCKTVARRAGGTDRRPNVVFLISDDQRYDTIHALGNDVIRTPSLDALVAGGTAFTNPYIMGSTQGAVCVCSRAMLLTGRTLWHSPGNCPPGLPLWPQVMRDAGYVTFGAGKWHNGAPSYARCFSQGGSIFFGGMTNQSKVPVHEFDPTGKYPKANQRVVERFSSELFTDTAIRFLRGYREDKPFFLYVAYTAPHDPRTAPGKYAAMYRPDRVPLPPNFMPEHPFDNGEMKVRDEQLAPWPRTPDVVRKHIADYYAMISHLDSQIGRIIEALEQTGHADDTIVIFAGDNGLALGQHGLMGKQNVYEHSVRVPLVMSGPGLPQGVKRDAFCYLHDVFPTVCEMTGVPAPSTIEGTSLVPVISGKSDQVRDFIFAAYMSVQRMVRDERCKLIRYSVRGAKRTQLFDLVSDPWERNDVSSDTSHAATLAALDAKLKEWQKLADDPLAAPQTS